MADDSQAKPTNPPTDAPNQDAQGGAPAPAYEEQDPEALLAQRQHLDPRVVELSAPTGARDLEAVYNIGVRVTAVLGKSTMPVGDLLKLGRNSIVELDRKVGEAIDIYVNNRLVARGEVVLVENRLGVTMTEIVKSDKSNY